ncbi:MAG: DNRLRE domain-containing protein [Candidatus Woesearchaeota archaeon]
MKKIIWLFMMIMAIQTVIAGTEKIYPSEDAYTDSSAAGSTFNNFDLRVGNDQNHGKHRSYLKFDLAPLDGKTITNAKFSIDPVARIGSFTTQLYYVGSDSWSQSSLKWSNAPTHSTLVDSKIISSGDRVEFNVMPLINEQDKILSIALVSAQETSAGNYVQFFSNNNLEETYKPYLQVTYDGGECNTQADTNCNGCVEILEVLDYINGWKIGNVIITDLLNTISNWKTGVGCS